VIVLLAVAAVVVGAPLGAAVLVTIASHYEDAARSLGTRPPGPFAAAARRLVCLRIGGTAYPRRQGRRIPPVPEPEAGHAASDRTPPLTLSRR
jgi:hypothetical protein